MERTPENNTGPSNAEGQRRETRGRPDRGPRYFIINDTPEKQANYIANLSSQRNVEKPSGRIASIAQMTKAALGAGILSAHVAFMEGGLVTSLVFSVVIGAFVVYSLYLIGFCEQICCASTAVPSMSYPDVAEASFAISKFPFLRKISRYVRYVIDISICFELFGACACYQLMVSFSIKQLVEDTHKTSLAGLPGYPSLRIYLLAMLIPFVCICLIRHLQWLAPASLVGNLFVVVCIIATIYYSAEENPRFQGMTMYTSLSGAFTFAGMIVFSMTCVGVVVPVENNLRNPGQFKMVVITGFTTVCATVVLSAFFGYNAYRDECLTPITLNFPMELFPNMLKVVIALNLYLTHGINFWIPFNLTFAYIKKLHKPERWIMFEYIYRAGMCMGITLIAIAFPDVPKVMSFLGCFCICLAGFVFPNLIHLVLSWDHPGLGRFKWRLLRAVILITFGIILFIAGSVVSLVQLISLFTTNEETDVLRMNYNARDVNEM